MAEGGMMRLVEPWQEGPPRGQFDDEETVPMPRFDEAPVRYPFDVVDTEAIFADLPPIDWVCQGLGLTPGAAACFAGYGFVGKTVIAQSIALAVAAGGDVWGLFSSKRGNVVH